MSCWDLISGRYPPDHGGVADYTELVAVALSGAGDEVHVWAPAPGTAAVHTRRPPVPIIHSLPDRFGPRSMKLLNAKMGSGKILVQYVPQAFGWRGMNLPFCLWLQARARRQKLWVMFHEVAFSLNRRQPLRYNVLGVVTRLMASIVARSADRIFVSIPAWETVLRKLSTITKPIVWCPVPSNIPVVDDPEGTMKIRLRYSRSGSRLLGHFGTYNEAIAGMLEELIPDVLRTRTDASILLMGKNSDVFRSELGRRHGDVIDHVSATGELSDRELSAHVSACDMMLQPYPDGVSARRTTMSALLAHSRAVVTTSGHLTEPLWLQSGAVALSPVGDRSSFLENVDRYLSDARARKQLGCLARSLYQERFDLRHTLYILDQAVYG
jgi:hypothetical protein